MGRIETKKVLQDIVEVLKEKYSPERIILFGSRAHGIPDEESDIDLLIVKDTKESPHRRTVAVRRLISPLRTGFSVDVFVITPDELHTRLVLGDQFLEEIHSNGEVLYAR
ncbi:MAG: nucleotidyltransferase domain-containing protein [Candidatus Methylomirabilales bacterium]